MSRPVFSCCIHIPSHSVSSVLSFLPSVTTSRAIVFFDSSFSFYNLASNYWYGNDVKMILPSFHWAKHIGWHGGNSSTRLVGGTSATQTPCELYSILRINPFEWTSVHQLHNGSVHKQNNISVIVRSSVWENLFYFGSLAIRLAKNKTKHIVWVVRKTRPDILLADLVCFEVQCLPRSAHLKIFLIFVILVTSFSICVSILNKNVLHQLLLVCLLVRFLLFYY